MMTSESQRSCLDNLQPGNSNTTIPVSQSKECLPLGSFHLSSFNFLMLKSDEEQSNISIVLNKTNSNTTIPVSQSHQFSYCNVLI
jgi:hypothetical protein